MDDHFTTEDMIYEYLTRYYDSNPRHGAEQIAHLMRCMYTYMIEISFDNENNQKFSSAGEFVDMVMNDHDSKKFRNFSC